MKELSTEWTKDYDKLAYEAANTPSGHFLILGTIQASLDINAAGYDTDEETIAHIRYLIQAYYKAKGFNMER